MQKDFVNHCGLLPQVQHGEGSRVNLGPACPPWLGSFELTKSQCVHSGKPVIGFVRLVRILIVAASSREFGSSIPILVRFLSSYAGAIAELIQLNLLSV